MMRVAEGTHTPAQRVQPGLADCQDRALASASPETQCLIEPSGSNDLLVIPAGWPEKIGAGCCRLDAAAVLRATPRSFALRVHGQSMANAGIYDGNIVVGEATPEACPGAIVVALMDGASTLKRLVIDHGRPCLMSENPDFPDMIPLSELVIQGVIHTVVQRVH